MTIQEKAKAYDEAIERAKNVLLDCTQEEQKVVEYIVPELKESEDEKIREALIEMVHDTTGDSLWVDYNVHKEDALAWLEKQGKNEKINEISYRIGIKRVLDNPESYGLEKQGEQKPTEWTAEDENQRINTIGLVKNANDCAGILDKETALNWLNDIKDRFVPQPKREWSQEDAKALNRISTILVDASKVKNWWKEYRLIERDEMIRLTDFLKSFKDRYTWKPSEEQLNALHWCVMNVGGTEHQVLQELLEQLEKLKE